MLANLMDLDRNYGQASPRMLTCQQTRRRAMVSRAKMSGLPEIEPYERDYPATFTAGMSESLIPVLMNRLEHTLDDAPLLPLRARSGLDAFTQSYALGHWTGGVDLDPFQVAYLGGTRWKCRGGQVYNPSTQTFAIVEDAEIDLLEGFIGFYCDYSPLHDEEAGNARYPTSIIQGLEGVTTYQQHPARRTQPEIGSDSFTTWGRGRVFYPLAHVTAALSDARPVIRDILGGSNLRFRDEFLAVLGVPILNAEL